MLLEPRVRTTQHAAGSAHIAGGIDIAVNVEAVGGAYHADADVASWMRDAGFERVGVRALPPPMPHRVVQGVSS